MKFFWSQLTEDSAHSEQEKVDYSAYSKDELLDTFKTENWEKLNDENRIAIIQEMENRTAVEQGRPPAEIVSSYDAGTYGGYTSTNNQISINVSDFSSYETLDTYVHESTHAYQSHCIQTGEGYDDHTLSMMEAEMARDEQGNLYNYARSSPEYDMQCDELDSNNKAAIFMLEQRERYEHDPDYRTYIEERAAHFSEVNATLDGNSEDRVRLQNNQAYVAFIRGDISEDQYNALSEEINNEEHQDPTVIQSHNIGDAIEALNIEYQNNNEHSNIANNEYLGNIEENSEILADDMYIGTTNDVGRSNDEESYLGTANHVEIESSHTEIIENSEDYSADME